jgi:thioredoxin 1
MLGPIIEELHGDYDGKAVVGKVDVDNNQQIAMQYGIRNIPTVLIFKNGEVVDKFVGVAPKASIAEKLNSFL